MFEAPFVAYLAGIVDIYRLKEIDVNFEVKIVHETLTITYSEKEINGLIKGVVRVRIFGHSRLW